MKNEKESKVKFDMWILHLPPINLWNIHLIYKYYK